MQFSFYQNLVQNFKNMFYCNFKIMKAASTTLGSLSNNYHPMISELFVMPLSSYLH